MKTPMQAMEFARQTFVDMLHKPRRYRVGKVSSTAVGKTRREAILDVMGPGVLRRLWTTHLSADQIKIYIFIDGDDRPALSGMAHEIAQMASSICCPQIPLGGFYDQRSASLYLPISFARSLRIEAEPMGDIGDGPYWQIDYSLGDRQHWPPPRQVTRDGQMQLHYDELPPTPPAFGGPVKVFEQQLELSIASPQNIWLEGGGIIRQITISGTSLDSLMLRIGFDVDRPADDRLDGPFQVDAPLRYLVGQFNNACVQRLGSTAVIHFPMPFRVRAGIGLLAGMDYGEFHTRYLVNLRVEYKPQAPPAEEMRYFHARFNASTPNGRDDFECLSTHGRGHFVGVHIFDTGHDHGGGDNIMLDAAADSAAQLHGICGEDYFHMAYMRIWNLTPYSGCPSHSARYRHHLEMPIPFEESFVFNWGCFAAQPAKSVAFWYLDRPEHEDRRPELIYMLSGPFDLQRLDDLAPHQPLPEQARVWRDGTQRPTLRWHKTAQCGFVDLCHIHRRYIWPVPHSAAPLVNDVCTVADTRLWAARDAKVLIRIGCDDAIRLYLNGQRIFADEGRNQPDPFRLFKVDAALRQGVNELRAVVANTTNYNWN
jgi:hypothetical protein